MVINVETSGQTPRRPFLFSRRRTDRSLLRALRSLSPSAETLAGSSWAAVGVRVSLRSGEGGTAPHPGRRRSRPPLQGAPRPRAEAPRPRRTGTGKAESRAESAGRQVSGSTTARDPTCADPTLSPLRPLPALSPPGRDRGAPRGLDAHRPT